MVQFKRMWSRDSGRFKLIRTIGALPQHGRNCIIEIE